MRRGRRPASPDSIWRPRAACPVSRVPFRTAARPQAALSVLRGALQLRWHRCSATFAARARSATSQVQPSAHNAHPGSQLLRPAQQHVRRVRLARSAATPEQRRALPAPPAPSEALALLCRVNSVREEPSAMRPAVWSARGVQSEPPAPPRAPSAARRAPSEASRQLWACWNASPAHPGPWRQPPAAARVLSAAPEPTHPPTAAANVCRAHPEARATRPGPVTASCVPRVPSLPTLAWSPVRRVRPERSPTAPVQLPARYAR